MGLPIPTQTNLYSQACRLPIASSKVTQDNNLVLTQEQLVQAVVATGTKVVVVLVHGLAFVVCCATCVHRTPPRSPAGHSVDSAERQRHHQRWFCRSVFVMQAQHCDSCGTQASRRARQLQKSCLACTTLLAAFPCRGLCPPRSCRHVMAKDNNCRLTFHHVRSSTTTSRPAVRTISTGMMELLRPQLTYCSVDGPIGALWSFGHGLSYTTVCESGTTSILKSSLHSSSTRTWSSSRRPP